MKVIFQDLKKGIVKLLVQSPEDLWHLQNLLEQRDLITGRTRRKKVIKRGKELDYGEKKAMTLTIDLERAEFHRDTGKLRLLGKIVSGPDDVDLGSHHTIQVEEGLILKIQKEKWKPYHIDRLKKARIKQPLLFVCMIDREQADFAALLESGIEFFGSKYFKKVKGREDDRSDYYKGIMDYLEKQEKYQSIILAGPGFERENLFEFIKNKNPKLAEKIVLEHAHCTGKTGVQEVIKKSAIRILRETRLAKETEIVERLFAEIKKDGLAVYGEKETKRALESGAIKTFLVSDKRVRDFENLLELAEKIKSEIIIISSEHENGERFLNLGGIAGFLRFRI